MKIKQAADRSESHSHENERPLLSHNIFMKNDNYCINFLVLIEIDYSDEVKLTRIFQKFYYENFKLED
jgi:hypothetical protein